MCQTWFYSVLVCSQVNVSDFFWPNSIHEFDLVNRVQWVLWVKIDQVQMLTLKSWVARWNNPPASSGSPSGHWCAYTAYTDFFFNGSHRQPQFEWLTSLLRCMRCMLAQKNIKIFREWRRRWWPGLMTRREWYFRISQNKLFCAGRFLEVVKINDFKLKTFSTY